MPTSTIILLLTLGAALVVGSFLVRVLSGGKHEIKTIDLVFLVVPLLLVGLATGKLKGVDMFGVKADLSELWTAAAQAKIAKQVAPASSVTVQDVVQVVEMATKGGAQELQRLIERRTEALEFKLGHGGYYAPAIRTYLEALSGTSYLRVIVVDKPDGTLFGVYSAPDLLGYLRVAGSEGYERLQRLLNSGSNGATAELATLPGFVAAGDAVTATTSKRDALARMEKLDADSLPVVDEQGRFAGTVERTKLTASLILAVTDKVEGQGH